jgi:hypothetical protein
MHFLKLHVFHRLRRRGQADLRPPLSPDRLDPGSAGGLMHPVTSLTTVCNASSRLYTRFKVWIGREPSVIRLRFAATGSVEARTKFPNLPSGELAVITDTGEVWLSNHVWTVCLWALRDYRDLADRLTSPLLTLVAREAFTAVSRNRLALSSMLRPSSDWAIEQHLRQVVVPKCEIAAK